MKNKMKSQISGRVEEKMSRAASEEDTNKEVKPF